MKRVFVDGSNTLMSRAQRLKSLIFLVFIPYIEGKLTNYRDRIENTDPHLVNALFLFELKLPTN